MDESNLARVSRYLACVYMSEEQAIKDNPQKCWEGMLEDIQECVLRMRRTQKCSVWAAAQRCAGVLLHYDKEWSCHSKARRIKPEQIAAIIEVWLHFHRGLPQKLLTWPLLEALLSGPIDQALSFKDIPESQLPDSLWIELEGKPSLKLPSWLAKTVGIMLTRIPLHDFAESGILQTLRGLPHWEHTIDMFEALCDCEGRRIAFTATVVQSEGLGYRFVPTVFGHEETGAIQDALALHREITQKRKLRDIERTAVELCMRILLMKAGLIVSC